MVVYVHIPPNLMTLTDDVFHHNFLFQTLSYSVGRTSVALLSIVSGYLLANSSKRFFDQVGSKIKAIIVPMIIWNIIAAIALFIVNGGILFNGINDGINKIFAITNYPAAGQLYFLRDIFVCFLISPLIFFLVERFGKLSFFLLLVFLVGNSLLDLDDVLLINSHILLFFVIGIGFSKRFNLLDLVSLNAKKNVLLPSSFFFLLGTIITPVFIDPSFWHLDEGKFTLNALVLIARFPAALLFWYLTENILSTDPLRAFLLRYEPVIFVVFCCHLLVIRLIWSVMSSAGITVGSIYHLTLYFAAPLISLVAGVLLVVLLRFVSPAATGFIMGGRRPSDEQLRDMVWPFARS
jgi:surface polysaccharide O-acyltransferase-like enzyme